jgi:phosphoribosylamine-glycine ligase
MKPVGIKSRQRDGKQAGNVFCGVCVKQQVAEARRRADYMLGTAIDPMSNKKVVIDQLLTGNVFARTRAIFLEPGVQFQGNIGMHQIFSEHE